MNPTLLQPNMRYWRMRPDPRLRAHVVCYFLARPPGGAAGAPWAPPPLEEELLLPDGHSEIVFVLGGPYERRAVGQAGQRCVMRHSYVIGGRSHSVLTRDLGPVTVAGVKLDPRALRWLIDTPLVEFRDATLTLSELQHAPLLELEDAIARATSAREVAQELDRYLLEALRDMPPPSRPIDDLIGQIVSSRGGLSIMSWVDRHGLDARQVERNFSAEVGMTPKRFARVIRFKHSYHQLIAGTTRPSGMHLDGFYDQSHFNKEFKTFVGAAPTARLGAMLQQGTSISDHLLAGELSLR